MMMKHDLPVRNRFGEAVRNLLLQIEPLLISVKGCAEVLDQVPELAQRRDGEQEAVNELQHTGEGRQLSQGRKRLASLNDKLDKLYEPFPSTEGEIYKFLRNLKTVLKVVPTEPAQLLSLRAEIERLEIWENGQSPILAMQSSLGDLEAIKQRLDEMLGCLEKDNEVVESPRSLSNLTDLAPPKGRRRRVRVPDIETSRRRIELEERLTSELTAIAQRAEKFTTLSDLQRRYPGFTLWNRLPEQEQKELLTIPFKPKTYARSLVLRAFGINSPDTLKKDRQKLRRAGG